MESLEGPPGQNRKCCDIRVLSHFATMAPQAKVNDRLCNVVYGHV